MKQAIAGIAKAAVTAALFYLLFRNNAFHDLIGTISAGRTSLILAAFALVWAGHFLCMVRWRLLMRPLSLRLPAARLLAVYCVGVFFNIAFPTLVGGDVARIYYAGKPSGRYTQSFAATYLDRSSGMLAMMAVAVAATLVCSLEIPGVPARTIVWSAFAAFALFNVAVLMPRLHIVLTGALRRLGRARTAARIDSISQAFRTMLGDRGAVFGAAALSLSNQFLVVLTVWLVSRSLELKVGLASFFLVVPVVAMVTMIPVSVNGMGLREYAFVALLAGLGVGRAEAAAVGLLCSSFLVLSAIPGGIIYVFLRNRDGAVRMNDLETNLT